MSALATAQHVAADPAADAPAPPVPAATPEAQSPGWSAGVEIKKSTPSPVQKPRNTTVIERVGEGKSTDEPGLRLVALLTADGQQIDQGLIWRVFQAQATGGKAKLVAENREASPSLRLSPGDYTVNAAFGRANLTRKVSVKPGPAATEQFVLNAGGLRINAIAAGKSAVPGAVTYTVLSDDRDQTSNRSTIMSNAKPGLIIRLNAGFYHIVSCYGDANAKVETDVTVEAGKMTEASIVHSGGKASFKLVARAGGDALPETTWTFQDKDGETVRESAGALPSHIFAPGDYVVMARSGGQIYRKPFSVKNGEAVSVEVVQDGGSAATSDEAIQPSLEIKSP